MSAYSDLILSRSPAAYWRLGESAGTTGTSSVIDDSGNAHHGTPNGGVTFGTTGVLAGDADTAATFDATDDYVEFPAGSSILPSATSATLEAWIEIGGATGDQRLLSLASGGSSSRFAILWDRAAGRVSAFGRTSTGSLVQIDSASTYSTGDTLHIAATVAGTAMALYVNGASAATGTVDAGTTLSLDSTTTKLAANPLANGSRFGGLIDEAAIYAAALTAAQVAEHYDMGVNGPASSLLLRRRHAARRRFAL